MRHVLLIAVLGVCGCGGSGNVGDAGEDRADVGDVPTDTAPICGNGVVESGEVCDDGNFAAGDGCSPTCLGEFCGSGEVDPGEECDEGVWVNSDEPDATCRTNCLHARCGDGVVDTGEACDDGNPTADDGCSPACTLDCGNGVIQPNEECDGGADNSDEPDAACRTNCTARRCGDGVIDTSEECDLLNLDGETCVRRSHEAGGTLRCDATCRFDESWCRNPTCGDGTCDLGETASGCPVDCHDGCGDGACAEAEDQFGCPADCGAVAIAAGGESSCAALADGTARCWGSNRAGELGNRGAYVWDFFNYPLPVSDLTGVVDLAAAGGFDGRTRDSGHACAVLSDGTVRCWGDNTTGQLGDGTGTSHSQVPVSVLGLTGAVAIDAGWYHACALLRDGTVRCWGNNDHGQLGDGTSSGDVPVAVADVARAVGIATGRFNSCALLADGTAKCWGRGPVAVTGLVGAVDLSATGAVGCTGTAYHWTIGSHSCALLVDGTARCWGSNDRGQLGDGSWVASDIPVTVSGLASISAISVETCLSCARLSDGSVWCWGSGAPIPSAVSGLTGVYDLSVGGFAADQGVFRRLQRHTCAALSDGSAWCWGDNDSGQLGDHTNTSSAVPVQVAAW